MSFLKRLRSHRSSKQQKPQIQTQHLQPQPFNDTYLSPRVDSVYNNNGLYIRTPSTTPVSPSIVISPPQHTDASYNSNNYASSYMVPSPTSSIATTASSTFPGSTDDYVPNMTITPSASQKKRNAAWERAANRIHQNHMSTAPTTAAGAKQSIEVAQLPAEADSDPTPPSRPSFSSWLTGSSGSRAPQSKAEMDFETWLREI